MRQVVGGENQRFREPAGALFVFQSVLLDLFENLAVGVGGRDLALDVGGVELAFVFQAVELLRAGLGVDEADFLALLEEDARHADVGLDGDGVEIDEEAFADGALVFVAVDHVGEIGLGVGGGRGGQADLDGVEVVEGVAPERQLRRRVAAVAFVGDDQIEGVNRDVELVGVVVAHVVAQLEGGLAAEEVDGHALDGADVDEGVARLRIEQVGGRQDLGVELRVVAQVVAVEALAVDLVDLVELQAGLRLERGEGVDGLGGKRPAVHEEENSPGDAGLHQPVNLIYQREGLAGAGCHRHQHLALAVGDGLLDGGVGLDLIRAEQGMIVRMSSEPAAGGVEVASQQFSQGRRSVQIGEPPGSIAFVAEIVKPDDFAIGGISEGDSEAIEVE